MKKIKHAFLITILSLTLLGNSFNSFAKVFEFSATPYIGGMVGPEKLGGIITYKPDGSRGADFYNQYSGGTLGGEINFEVFGFDIRARLDQFFDHSGLTGTMLQPIMLGFNTHFDSFLSGKHRPILGAHAGVAVGFKNTPQFPIDREQIANYGLNLEGDLGYEYQINRFVALDLFGTVGYHFLLAGAAPVNDQSTQTNGFHFLLRGGIRFHAGI